MNALLGTVAAESFKVVRKRRTYVVAALWWIVLPVLTLVVGQVLQANLGASFANEAGGVTAVVQEVASPYGIARIGLVGPAYLSPTFYIIVVALFAALLVGEERTQSMWKTVLVAQPNRLAVLLGKIVVAMLVLLVLLAGTAAAGAVFGGIGTLFLPTTWAGDWAGLLGLFALQWAFALGAVLFAFLAIHLVRSTALGIVIVLFLPGLLETIYTIYAAAVGFQPINRLNVFFQTIRMRQLLEDLPRSFFTTNLYAPARAPVGDLTGAFAATTGPGGGPGGGGPGAEAFAGLLGAVSLSHAALVMGVYCLLFGAILVWRFLRTDVD